MAFASVTASTDGKGFASVTATTSATGGGGVDTGGAQTLASKGSTRGVSFIVGSIVYYLLSGIIGSFQAFGIGSTAGRSLRIIIAGFAFSLQFSLGYAGFDNVLPCRTAVKPC
ncbi:hypothetical protein [Alteripontixanthobacter maritimus]|uniref:hypothetical protein n=1 Tax=Alteripontixanthobacter maritimus TaxID=2161824 RepID=UPI000E1B7E31|nr:hypothetical protein [Alteripontixanthobacter maritimus]